MFGKKKLASNVNETRIDALKLTEPLLTSAKSHTVSTYIVFLRMCLGLTCYNVCARIRKVPVLTGSRDQDQP